MKLEIGTRIRVLTDSLPFYRAGETGTVVDSADNEAAAFAEWGVGEGADVWVLFDREKTAEDDGFWNVTLDELEVLDEV